MSWTHPICAKCWNRREPNRMPYSVASEQPSPERCAFCGLATRSGIYVREDPRSVPFAFHEPGCRGNHFGNCYFS